MPPKRKREAGGDEARKRLRLRLLSRALKKARNFEVGKIKRRMKDQGEEAAAKLALQLQAAKAFNMESLAALLDQRAQAADHGKLTGTDDTPVQESAHCTPQAATVQARLLRARCVQDVLDELQMKVNGQDRGVAQSQGCGTEADATGTGVSGTVNAGSPCNTGAMHSDELLFVKDGTAAATQPSQARMRRTWNQGASGRAALPAEATTAIEEDLLNGGVVKGSSTCLTCNRQGQRKEEDVPLTRVRRNRPGQRTRRKQIEKLHGSEAHHLKVSAQRQSTGRTASPGGPRSRKIGHVGKACATRAPAQQEMNGRCDYTAKASNGSSQGNEDGTTHPSWAAKQVERKALMAAACGTRVVFGSTGEAAPGTQQCLSHGKSIQAGKSGRQGGRDKLHRTGAEEPLEVLHPSWEAARQQQSTSTGLVGRIDMHKRGNVKKF